MILEQRFNAQARGVDRQFFGVELPDRFEIESGLYLSFELGPRAIILIFELQVSHSTLSRATAIGYTESDRQFEYPCVEVSVDRSRIRHLADDVIACLSVLLEMPLSLYSSGRADRVVPEDDSDRRKIEELGTDKLFFGLQAGMPTSRTSRGSLTGSQIIDLLPRSPGLHLYADALQDALATATFRDCWRVLESAFNAIDDTLVELLGQYPPCLDLGFDCEELKDLLVLRGRASHAKSRIGLREKKQVDALCSKNLPRLKSLANRVILTKKSWGFPTLGVEEVQPYVRVQYG